MSITIDQIANYAVEIPQEIRDECACTGRLEKLQEKRKQVKLLIMQWYEQETTAAYKAKGTDTTTH